MLTVMKIISHFRCTMFRYEQWIYMWSMSNNADRRWNSSRLPSNTSDMWFKSMFSRCYVYRSTNRFSLWFLSNWLYRKRHLLWRFGWSNVYINNWTSILVVNILLNFNKHVLLIQAMVIQVLFKIITKKSIV